MSGVLVFDLDGPVLDVARRYAAVFAGAVEDLGGTAPALDDWAMRRAGFGRAERLAAAGVADREDAFARLWLARIEAPGVLGLDRLQPHVDAVLELLGRRVRPPVLVTYRRDAAALARQLRGLGVAGRFAAIASGPAPERDKAAGKVALLAGLGLTAPLSGWFVGDTVADMLAARRLGLRACAVGYGLTAPERLAEVEPDRLCADPEDLLTWAREVAGAAPAGGRHSGGAAR